MTIEAATAEYERQQDKLAAQQGRIDAYLLDASRDWKAQAVLEQIQGEVDAAMYAIKRACNPPEGCSDDVRHGFYRQAAAKALDAIVGAEALLLMAYQLHYSGLDLERSEQFRDRLERAAAEEIGL